MATEEMKMLRIVVFPWLAFGHLLPFSELSKYLARKGHQVSYISAPRNLQSLPKIPQKLLPQLRLVPLPLPQVEGLPPNAAATTDVPSDQIPSLRKAYRGLQERVARFLELASPVDWIIHDLNPWIGAITDGLGIKKAFFITTNAWRISVISPSPYIKELGDGPYNQSNNNLLYRLREAKKSLGDIQECSEETELSINDVIIIRSSRKFEAESLDLLRQLQRKPVVPVGLVPVSERDESEESDAWQEINGWLDKHSERSVVYVTLGSEVSPSQQQITELALGLEVSKSPFFWAQRLWAGLDEMGSPNQDTSP